MGLYWPNFSLVFLIHLFLHAGVYGTLKAHDATFKTTCTQIHVFDQGYVAKSWLSTERDLSTSSCRDNFEGVIEENASLTNRKSPLVSRKCWKDCCHVSHVNIQLIIYWHIVLMLNRTDSNKDLQEIGAANYAVLERIRVNRREDHLKVSQCNKHAFNWQSVRKWRNFAGFPVRQKNGQTLCCK